MLVRQKSQGWHWGSVWPAPAKLNLFLHVVGRRPDGYHLLQTVFRFIDRADYLRFAPRDDGEIVLKTPLPGVPPELDLTVRAAQLLQRETGCHRGVEVSLEKYLPMGGGLGGGSSDAATVLLALNHLWETGLSRPQLESLGLALGADVPVFVHGRNTFAQGVGEHFFDVDLPPMTYLVVHPAVNVPTGVIFGAPDLCRSTPPIDPASWLPGQGHNDLEPVACQAFAEVGKVLERLREEAPQALMTGSGACVFAGFSTCKEAETVLQRLPKTWSSWIAKGFDAHPLSDL